MQISENTGILSTEIHQKMAQYRQLLLAAGMLEPSKRNTSKSHYYFYKPASALTAFIINLREKDHCIELVYGYASTAFTRMAGDEMALVEWGVSDENITIREKLIICDEKDEEKAESQITNMYSKYSETEKDELLSLAKAKRREFIQQIAVKLKPLGFKKKANCWARTLEPNYHLTFNAQKSAFSDEYYFNVYIGKNGSSNYGDCYHTRLAPDGMFPMDWQSLSTDRFDEFLERDVVPFLEQIINTPLIELGKLPSVWACCNCNRKKCEPCWVQKNLREASLSNIKYH